MSRSSSSSRPKSGASWPSPAFGGVVGSAGQLPYQRYVVGLRDLAIRPRTVKFHQENLLRKTGASSRVELFRKLM